MSSSAKGECRTWHLIKDFQTHSLILSSVLSQAWNVPNPLPKCPLGFAFISNKSHHIFGALWGGGGLSVPVEPSQSTDALQKLQRAQYLPALTWLWCPADSGLL